MTFQRPAIQTPGCCDDYWWPTDKPTNGAGARGNCPHHCTIRGARQGRGKFCLVFAIGGSLGGSHPGANPLDQRSIDLLWRQWLRVPRASERHGDQRLSRVQGLGLPQVGHSTLAITCEDVDGPELETGVPVRRFPLRRSCESGLGTLLIIAAHGDRAGDEIRARRQRVEVTCRRKVRCGGLRITRPAIRGTVDVPGCSPRQCQRRKLRRQLRSSPSQRARCAPYAGADPARRSGQSLSRGQ